MIDALLSDRPDDRRELFEEAAGVGLYRDRRRTTERRLEETTVDLQRLDDLITEVQSQVRSLARQRKRAERYSELMARRFTVEIALAKREMDAWHDELQRLDERVRELRESAPERRRGGRHAPSRRATRRTAIAPPPKRSAPSCFASCPASASRCSRSAARWPSPKSASATRSRAASAPSSRRTRARPTASASRPIANRRADDARSTTNSCAAARETLAAAPAARKTRRGRSSRAMRARARRRRARASRAAGSRAPRRDRSRARAPARATSWRSASSSSPRSARSSPTR